MIDGSKLEYSENVRVTCEIVKAAHALGVDVEAELGKVGIAANTGDFKNEDMYTTAEQAADFVAKTKVDSLAIAIGSAHGWYVETPKLSMPRLKEINKAIDTPLVLHGGTGIPEDQLRESFKLGINKLNVRHRILRFILFDDKGLSAGQGQEGQPVRNAGLSEKR